ncbi:hypothetical protein IKF28_03145 [Candidatus Saccharibacteria bacterium]|nr:hypothetical protein [Candidatus Saccharibacteria bacterium]
MSYNHWFITRSKRKLITILPSLFAFYDTCVGKVWKNDLHIAYEDTLGARGITEHGNLRAREVGQGGGGGRTMFALMKDLGLVFREDGNKKCRLTLIGEDIIKGNIVFVDAIRLQLKRYQYPSAVRWSGSGSVSHEFKVHPFQFIFRLLRDERLENYLQAEEMRGIVIHYAISDNNRTYESVVQKILAYRQEVPNAGFVEDTPDKAYGNIANTFFNYISLTQWVDRDTGKIMIRHGKEADVDQFIEDNPSFIQHPEVTENYIRTYGRGNATRDLRNFAREKSQSQRELSEIRIREEYLKLAIAMPITSITSEIVQTISDRTGIDDRTVESYLIQNHRHGSLSEFFMAYRELAHSGRAGATDFELATCEIFQRLFHMRAKHVGPDGNTPDVFIESSECGYCGIIDNKAYHDKYSITAGHKRAMLVDYIPKYRGYGETDLPLAFYTYIAGSFGTNINNQLAAITKETGINGSAMPVDILIDFAQDYAERGCDHEYIKNLFSVNREIRLQDIATTK